MFRFLAISMCFVSVLNAGLREEIAQNFDRCMSAKEEKFLREDIDKFSCFNDFEKSMQTHLKGNVLAIIIKRNV